MPLAAGTRLGPYEISTPLGAGGMGEVYRARDARLGREVAVKVLPTEVVSSPDRLRRFELEARAAGADGQRAAATQGAGFGGSDRSRAGRRPREGHRPSRYQARERVRHQGRA